MRISKKDIGRLKIPMDHPKRIETLVAFDYLFDETNSIILLKFLFGLDIFAQVAPFAEVGDDISFVLIGVDLLDVEQIRPVLYHTENFDFPSQ